jgi:hypothetical protein
MVSKGVSRFPSVLRPGRIRTDSMSDMTDPDAVSTQTRVCQIIVGTLIAGVTVFLLLVLLIIPPLGNKPPDGPMMIGGVPLLTLLAMFLGTSGLAFSVVIPRLATAGMRRTLARGTFPTTRPAKPPPAPVQAYVAGDTAPLLQIYQTQVIIGSALCEGVTFFALIAYLLERHPAALATAITLIVCLALRFPTANHVNSWINEQLNLLQEDRQAAL